MTEKLNGKGEKQVRCDCNKLQCVVRGNSVEIKCGKCKRLVVIETRGIVGWECRQGVV